MSFWNTKKSTANTFGDNEFSRDDADSVLEIYKVLLTFMCAVQCILVLALILFK